MTQDELAKWLTGVGQVLRLVRGDPNADARLRAKAAELDEAFDAAEAALAGARDAVLEEAALQALRHTDVVSAADGIRDLKPQPTSEQ